MLLRVRQYQTYGLVFADRLVAAPGSRDMGIGRGPGTFDGEPLPELGASFVVHRVRSPGRNRLPVPPVSVTRPMVALAWSKPSCRRCFIVLHYAQPLTRNARLAVDEVVHDGKQHFSGWGNLPPPAPEPAAFLLLVCIADRGHMTTATSQAPSGFPGRGRVSASAPLTCPRSTRSVSPWAATRGPPPDNSSLRCPLPRARTLSATTTTPAPASSERPAPRRPIRTVTSGLGSSGNRRHAHTVPSHHLLRIVPGRPGPEVVATA